MRERILGPLLIFRMLPAIAKLLTNVMIALGINQAIVPMIGIDINGDCQAISRRSLATETPPKLIGAFKLADSLSTLYKSKNINFAI